VSTKLPRSFYARSTPLVARHLVGKVLVKSDSDGSASGRIVETEAYTGADDPASHAFRGLSDRNRVMFGLAGHLYVYLSYGVHYCCNVVTESELVAGAVLIRALEPLTGIESMTARRGARAIRDLCNGPGKLCQALGIDMSDYGADLEAATIWMEDDGFEVGKLVAGGRVGISAAADRPLRFFLPDSPFVSPGKPAAAPARLRMAHGSPNRTDTAL
jgi:DNA-3-methyladenine glycosylase